MMRAVALVLVLALVAVARQMGGEVSDRFATMALGFVLIVAALAGEAGEKIKLPRLTGYLLVGLAFGPAVLDLITPVMAQHLRLVNGLAVALIAFGAGMELDLPKLKEQWRSLASHGGVLIGFLFVGLFLVTLAATPFLPFSSGETWPVRVGIALIVAATMTTFSPSVTMAVLSETRAKGPLAERVLALVVLGDLAILLLFTFSTTVARLLSGKGFEIADVLGHVAWEVLGSPVIGVVVGIGIYFYRRYVDRRSGLLVAAVCLILAEVGARIGLSPLLACLAAGMVVRNADPESAHAMEELIARIRLPVLVVFFAAAGASLHLDYLAKLWPVVLGLVVVRGLLIRSGNDFGSKAAGLSPPVSGHIPYGLVSQAGVTMGLAVIVGRDFGDWGMALETLCIATISVHELIGPIAFRTALARLGEIPPEEQQPVMETTPAPG